MSFWIAYYITTSGTNFGEPDIQSPPNSKKPWAASTGDPNQNDTKETQKVFQANHSEIQERQKMLLDLQIEEKKVDLELKKTQLEKEQLQCRELKLKIEQLEKNKNI